MTVKNYVLTRSGSEIKRYFLSLPDSKVNGFEPVEEFNTDLSVDTLGALYTGKLTSNNGVISGFSTEKYLKIDNKYKSSNNAEYVFKFTTDNSFSAHQVVIHAEYFFNLEIGTNKSVGFYNWQTTKSTSLFIASENTTYWVKIVVSGITKTYTYSTDGVNFTGTKTITDSACDPTRTDFTFNLGLSSYNQTGPFLGSIDLPNCYIKINGTEVWKGGTGNTKLAAGSYFFAPVGLDTDSDYPLGYISPNEVYTVVKRYIKDGKAFVKCKCLKDIIKPLDYTSNADSYITSISINIYEESLDVTPIKDISSGTTVPTGGVFYNLDTNKINYYFFATIFNNKIFSFPIGLAVKEDNNPADRISEIFTTSSIIGSSVIAFPGVKYYAANGIGTIKKYIEKTYDNLIIYTIPDINTLDNACINIANDTIRIRNYVESASTPSTTYTVWYNPEDNTTKESTTTEGSFTTGLWVRIGSLTTDGGDPSKITFYSNRNNLTTLKNLYLLRRESS